MKLEDIKEIIRMVDDSSITDFKYKEGEEQLILQKKTRSEKVVVTETPVCVSNAGEVSVQNDEEDSENSYTVVSPLVGTVYLSPEENGDPFVKEGDAVEAGQVIAIVEAMKLMNEITTEQAGTIQKILVENGQTVEYGQPLFQLMI